MEPRKIQRAAPGEFAFDISGGNLCLDFANTVSRQRHAPREHLHGFADLVAWGRQAGAISSAQGAQLRRAAGQRPAAAGAALGRALELRESLYRIFSATAARRPAPAADVAVLNRAAAEAFRHLSVQRDGRCFNWEWKEEEAGLDRVLWPVVRSAAELLTTPRDLARVRECAAGPCGWLFLDASKNGSRRWCSMKICGNREKARRFYRRRGAGTG